ncbi:hypothetical protein D8I24_6569 [Cupriavidus necator H850]|nr:hypothetical protein D8I24_6569 [Cupriavidus necator H850]
MAGRVSSTWPRCPRWHYRLPRGIGAASRIGRGIDEMKNFISEIR